MACLLWWVAESKTHPDYVRAPFYFDAILKWHASLSLDGNELCGTVHEVYSTPRRVGLHSGKRSTGSNEPTTTGPASTDIRIGRFAKWAV
jgi:hypothetical protein